MKKMIAFALAMLLALSVPAMAAEGDVLLGHDGTEVPQYFRACFSEGDVFYMVGYENICTYRVGDADWKQYRIDHGEAIGRVGVEIQLVPFISEGALYAVQLTSHYGDEQNEFDRAALCALTLNDDGTVAVEEQRELDWTDMVEYFSDGGSYASVPDGVVAIGRKLLMRAYDDQGEGLIRVLDLNTGRITQAEGLDGAATIAPYKDGTALVQLYDYNQGGKIRFAAYDPEAESVQMLGEAESTEYGPLRGVAYDPEADAAYCVKSGEICPLDLATGEIGEGIAEMPLEMYVGGPAPCILTGGYYAYANDGAVVRSLHPGEQSGAKLKICDSTWSNAVNDAYYRFSNAHGDVRVAITRDYSDGQNIIESMMNRDSGVDIYVMGTSNADYEAVYNRGYMLELDGCEKVNAFADAAYPSLADKLRYKGSVVALPVEAYGYTMGVNNKALESLGLTLDDVPTNWVDFLAFLNTLPEKLEQNGKITLFWDGMTIEDVRSQLFYNMFETYQNYVNATDPAMGYNTDRMRRMLAALDAVDFEALGFVHQEEADGNTSYAVTYGGSDESQTELFQTGVGCTFGNFYGMNSSPILMSVDADTPAMLSLYVTAAFVNPFTQNPEAAKAFMEELADCLPAGVRYCFNPALDTPIRGEYNEKNLQEYGEELDKMKAQLDTAEPEEKQALEEAIREMDEAVGYMRDYAWDVGEKDIEWFRANDDSLSIIGANWLYSDNSGEAQELMNQYLAGQISGDSMLAGIDKKVQMMLMEGN